MPIEIRELHIKAVIDTAGSKPAMGEGVNAGNLPGGNASAADAEQLVDLCVEKIMEIIKEKSER